MLAIDPLAVNELPDRERLMQECGIARGKAAGIVLAQRANTVAIFVSSDARACEMAQREGVATFTLIDVLDSWIRQDNPTMAAFDSLIVGLRDAKFGLTSESGRVMRDRLSAIGHNSV